MDYFKMTERELASCYFNAREELRRRQGILASAEGDPLGTIRGQESAKRAMLVAAAGHHPILLVGPHGCGKTMLRAAGHQLGVISYEVLPCPCGNFTVPDKTCNCTAEQIEAYRQQWVRTDITVELKQPKDYDQPGTAFQYWLDSLEHCGKGTSLKISDLNGAADLVKAARAHLGLSQRVVDVAIRVARTIANLDYEPHIGPAHLSEALQYRPLAGSVDQ